MPHDMPRRSPSMPRRSLLLAAGLVGAGIAVPACAASAEPVAGVAPSPSPTTPDEALKRLLAGNRRFVQGRAEHPRQAPADVAALASGQHPFAVTVGCADSRVPPEILFDQGVGDVFDNRVAGYIVDDLMLGSIEYAVEHLGPKAVVVLGHERCGAVAATVDVIEKGAEAPGHIAAIVDALRPIVEPALREPGDKLDNAVRANIRAQVRTLLEKSEIVRTKADAGKLAVVGARYDLDTAGVTLLS